MTIINFIFYIYTFDCFLSDLVKAVDSISFVISIAIIISNSNSLESTSTYATIMKIIIYILKLKKVLKFFITFN